MNKLITPIVIFIVAATFTNLSAQSTSDMQDVIYLRSGTVVRGTLTELIPDSIVKISTSDSDFTFPMRDVEKITKEPRVRRRTDEVRTYKRSASQTNIYGVPSLYHSDKYMFGRQINPIGNLKDPFIAGLVSFFVPGAGQFYTGDNVSGSIMMSANVINNIIWFSGDHDINSIHLVIGAAVALWSTISAVQTAKLVNEVRGYTASRRVKFNVQPASIDTPKYISGSSNNPLNNAYGLSAVLKF